MLSPQRDIKTFQTKAATLCPVFCFSCALRVWSGAVRDGSRRSRPVTMSNGCRYKRAEQRMGFIRAALKLWMKLGPKHKGVPRNFGNLHQLTIRRQPTKAQAGFCQSLPEEII